MRKLTVLNKRLVSTMTPVHRHSSPSPTITIPHSHRPLSPFISIYQPQLTWIMSIGHRVTGASVAGLVYAMGISSSLIPSGTNLTLKICELISILPVPVVLISKFLLAVPFTYHLFNGVRHLIWDSGRALTMRGVYATGWIVNISTLITSTILTLL